MTHAAAQPVAEVDLATRGRRFAGFILDVLIGAFTFGVGWLVWFLIIAGHGQTPAKQLLRMRVVREDGQTASYGWMLLREIVIRVIAFYVLYFTLDSIVSGSGWIVTALWGVCALWCVWDANRQCLWDKAVRTRVVHDPEDASVSAPVRTDSSDAVENIRTLVEMRDRGLLTDAEYEKRRLRELERLWRETRG